MLSEEIKSIQAALGVLAGRVNEEDWALIKLARANLADLADRARELESKIRIIPTSTEAA